MRRLAFSLDPRSGEAAKNSARLPERLVFRSHSSALTTTAVVRPFRVIVCGPRDCAKLMTSLNLAFASATVHVLGLIIEPVSLNDHDSHHSHLLSFSKSHWGNDARLQLLLDRNDMFEDGTRIIGYAGALEIPSAPSAASAGMEPELGRTPPPSAVESATALSSRFG